MDLCPKINNLILDTLFPKKCLLCEKEGFWLCEKCLPKIPLFIFQICPVCERSITQNGKPCKRCHRETDWPINNFLVATSYQLPEISLAIHYYKYRFIEDLAEPLGKILLRSFRQFELKIPDIIVPVPLHPRRLRWRGFNQAELLANYLSENLTPNFIIPVEKNIFRQRYTAPQMKVKKYAERKTNIQGAFQISPNSLVKNKTILLIDDVATTGSTLLECAKVLKAQSAKKIYSLVIARQFIKSPTSEKNELENILFGKVN